MSIASLHWTPETTTRRQDDLGQRHPRSSVRSADEFILDPADTLVPKEVRPHSNRGIFYLPPHSTRYYCGLLARTSSDKLLLGVAPYLGLGHRAIASAIQNRHGTDVVHLWGGEFMVVNPKNASHIGIARTFNETCGLMLERAVEAEEAYVLSWGLFARPLRRLRRIFSYGPMQGGLTKELRVVLQNSDVSIPFMIDSYTTYERFDEARQHLDRELDELNKALSSQHTPHTNLRHNIRGLITPIFLELAHYIGNPNPQSEAELHQMLPDFQDNLKLLMAVHKALMRDNSLYAKRAIHCPSIDDMILAQGSVLLSWAHLMIQFLKNIRDTFEETDDNYAQETVNIFELSNLGN